MQNENLNDFNRLHVMTVGRHSSVHFPDIGLQATISGLLGSQHELCGV